MTIQYYLDTANHYDTLKVSNFQYYYFSYLTAFFEYNISITILSSKLKILFLYPKMAVEWHFSKIISALSISVFSKLGQGFAGFCIRNMHKIFLCKTSEDQKFSLKA